MTIPYITFNPGIASQKPSNADACPFCIQDNLGAILEEKNDMIWAENKFPTLEKTYQTLIIESDDHFGDMSNYSQQKRRDLLAFMLEKWVELEKRRDFQSVVLYRNFGPLSGGSLRHPHSQIVGFKTIDAYANLQKAYFEGLIVCPETENQAEISISNKPMLDFTEFTIRISTPAKLPLLADALGFLCAYLLTDFLNGACRSYNLFFFRQDQALVCKLLPRFVVSPYMIGYGIHQVNQFERLDVIRKEIQAKLSKANNR